MTRTLAIAAVALLACSESKPAPDGGAGGGAGGGAANCVADMSSSAGAAVPLPGTSDRPMLCPVGDVDYYRVDVPAGNDLLDVAVDYPMSTTRVDLLATLLDAAGAPVQGAAIADQSPSDGKSQLDSTLRVAPGAYVLAVRDSGDDEKDDTNTYVVRVAPAKDPDTHEPNDGVEDAKAPDGQPGWIAYQGDRDFYRVTVGADRLLVRLRLENPMAARAVVHYEILDGRMATVAQGSANPSQVADEQRAVPAPGDYYVVISAEANRAPDRRPEAAYRLTVDTTGEADLNEGATRNDTGATATALGAPFSGSEVVFTQKVGQVGSSGDRDFFRLDVGGGAPAIVEIAAQIDPASPVDLAIDLLAPHGDSPCTADSQCVAINQGCSADEDCELSHTCLPEGTYHFCEGGQPCRRCVGASACVPGGAGMVCAAPQFLARDAGDAGVVRTAQPLFSAGPYYVVVHDYQDDVFEYGRDYRLDVRVLPEPDPADQGAAAMERNNFYNPYPQRSDDLAPNRMRSRDVDAVLAMGGEVTGWISYQSDQDWFSFRHPCPMSGANCGLQFEWTQPGPSPVRLAFLMREKGGNLFVSWTYVGGTPTTMLPAPVTDVFGDGDCRECSFARGDHADGDAEYRYHLQVRDVRADDWDPSPGGRYGFRLRPITMGCPASCSFATFADCACFCPDTMSCPAAPDL